MSGSKADESDRGRMAKTVLGIIGGSGFYQISGLERVERIDLETDRKSTRLNSSHH